jgi:DNA-binding transcriptional LysR family regulator
MGKAAALLEISQPSVSRAIADLERTIGVRLLSRNAKGVQLTPSGRAMFTHGHGAFEELRQGIKNIELLADPAAGEVRVGCPEAIASGLLSAGLSRFSLEHPRVTVSVFAADNLAQEFPLLRDRNIDFLLGGIPNRQYCMMSGP